MADHDHSYKLLFAQPEMVDHLLRHLSRREKWIAELDLSTLASVPAHRLSDDLRERENDIVWKVQWAGGWVYLMIEFQSSDDPWMAVRVMAYQALLYQDLIRQKIVKRPGDLPAVTAIVLYNGEAAWNATQEIAELIGEHPDGLDLYLPRLRFILVDISRLKPWELRQRDNLAVQVFRMEKCRTEEQVERELLGLFEELAKPGRSELMRAFLTWLRRVRLPSRFPGLELSILRQEEKNAMLEERVQGWIQKWLAQGRQEGLLTGRKEGEAETLAQLIEYKFGPLAADLRKRIQAADSSKRREWMRRILTATRLEEIFDPSDSQSVQT